MAVAQWWKESAVQRLRELRRRCLSHQAARIFQLHQILAAMYCVNLWLIKTSVVLLYHRIFVVRWFRTACVALIVFMSLYTITFIAAGESVCSKKQFAAYFTNLSTGTHLPGTQSCKDYMLIWYTFTSTSMLTDFITVLLPMPLVRKLQTTRKRKMLLTLLFGIGLIPCIASIMRLVDLKGDLELNMAYKTALLDLWTGAESSIGCLCANLPTLTPLASRAAEFRWKDEHATSRVWLHVCGEEAEAEGGEEMACGKFSVGEYRFDEF
ncbi:hypothetical protein K490DRAFT_57595 [Saccharata proteae CBS 121410]|uniref:Rhodopsin domain-containing protein n=1 Tax=Saccharata proteae CBS 121410 TaxID=1314787 RepID=A0A9P4LWM8_9PEZI|nr:hypothetical protein K490DRAFT_57595 [Saccharata proteae CBS 121410]